MELCDLVTALRCGEALAARQWVADAAAVSVDWSSLPCPDNLDDVGMAIAAGMVELLAQRAGRQPPAWSNGIASVSAPVFLVHAAHQLPRLRRLCLEEGPEPLRRRNIYAPPDFLTAA